MAWYPWATLPARSNITTGELVDWLRYRAIDFGAPAVFTDALDEIGRLEERCETLEGALAALVNSVPGSKERKEAFAEAKEILDEG